MSHRIATVCYAVNQGLGVLARSFFDAGVVTDPIVITHPGRGVEPSWYPAGTPILPPRSGRLAEREAVRKVLGTADAVVFFETPFDWELPNYCRSIGLRTVLVTMYEWSLKAPPATFDAYVCPSDLDMMYFKTGVRINIPVDPTTWVERPKALRFLHNGGNLSVLGRTGTAEVIAATKYLRTDLHLTIRAQESGLLQSLISQNNPRAMYDQRIAFKFGTIPYHELWKGFDVFVAPERFNGLSLPLQEARAAGLYVLTTDRHPANKWLPSEGLIPVAGKVVTAVRSGYNDMEVCTVDPQEIARRMDATFEKDISGYSRGGKDWAEANSWEQLKAPWLQAILGK